MYNICVLRKSKFRSVYFEDILEKSEDGTVELYMTVVTSFPE